MSGHPDDEFRAPTSDDPYGTETCWFTFAVPDRRLSAQLHRRYYADPAHRDHGEDEA